MGADWGEAGEWNWRGMRCHWRVLGAADAPAIVLVHGFGASSSHWRHNAHPLMEAGYRVFSLDLIGFGRSHQPGLSAGRSLDNRLWALQLAAFLREVVERPAVLVGNPLGGLTALTTAALAPQFVQAVVAAPLPDPPWIQPDRRRPPDGCDACSGCWCERPVGAPARTDRSLDQPNTAAARRLQGAYQRSIRNDRELQRLIAQPARRLSAPRSLRAMSVGMALRPSADDGTQVAGASAQPTPMGLRVLLLWGRQDRFVPLVIGESVSSNTLVGAEGAGQHRPLPP